MRMQSIYSSSWLSHPSCKNDSLHSSFAVKFRAEAGSSKPQAASTFLRWQQPSSALFTTVQHQPRNQRTSNSNNMALQKKRNVSDVGNCETKHLAAGPAHTEEVLPSIFHPRSSWGWTCSPGGLPASSSVPPLSTKPPDRQQGQTAPECIQALVVNLIRC